MNPTPGDLADHPPLAAPDDVHPSRLVIGIDPATTDGEAWVILCVEVDGALSQL